MPPTSRIKKCYIVFNESGDRRELIEEVDERNAVFAASATFCMKVGDVQEIDCNITEEEFIKIKPDLMKPLQPKATFPLEVDCDSTQEKSNEIEQYLIKQFQLSTAFFSENRADKLLIIGGVAIFVLFAFVYDIGVNGFVNLHKLQNRNIGCAVGSVLASVGAVRIAIAKRQ